MSVCLADGDQLRIGAYRGGFNDEVVRTFPRPLAGTISDMAMRQGSVLHRNSVLAATDLPEYAHELAREVGDFSIAERADVVGRPRHRHDRHRLPPAATILRRRRSHC